MARIHTVTRLYVLRDPEGRAARLLERGASIDEAVALASARIVRRRRVLGNILLAEGANAIWRLVAGQANSRGGLAPFDGTNSYIGVGDGTDPESPDQTGLTGANQYYKQVDSGYPVINGATISWRATFGPDEANFDWNEWTVANGPGNDYVNLNRRQESLGTKQSGQTWILEVSLTLS